MTNVETTAHEFCAALDAGDWTALALLLTPDCEYAFRGGALSGVAAVVDSYRVIGEWVHATFESVRYESGVEVLDGREARISFRDLIDHGEHHLDFRCQQQITLGDDGRIARITHIDIEGEPEKAARFNRACGVAKP